MGRQEPIDSGSNAGHAKVGLREVEMSFANKAGWQITDQYRVNQPHDRKTQRISRS